jgi:hypothetical protein
MNAMTKGLLALMAGWMLACGNVVDSETPALELARQEQGMCAVCGDGFCDPSAETPFNCPQDCRGFPTCGDGACCDGETPSSCPQDCPYASDICYVTPQGFARSASASLCAVCGDGYCDPSSENASNCPVDCSPPGGYCGDRYCNPATENEYNCPQDCGSPSGFCGDGYCNPATESQYNCPRDCGSPGGYCGDNYCDPNSETPFNCPQDCRGFPTCGDGACCDGETPSSCPQDCPYASDICYVTPQM